MSTDLALDIEFEDLKQQRIQDNAVFVPGGEAEEDMMGGGFQVKTTAEYIPIYSTIDGTVSIVRSDRVRSKCKLGADGKRAFWVKPTNPEWQYEFDPKIGGPRLVRQALRCYLHAEHPNRARYDALGLRDRVCTKSNIPTEFQLRMHMQRRHRVEWETIELAEQRERDEEARELQRQMVMALSRRGPGRPPKED